MISQIHIPKFPLNQFITCFIYQQGHNPAHSIDRFLPDGNVEIIIDLKDDPQHIYHDETFREIQSCRRIWASGVRTKPISIPSGKNSNMFIIAFKKGMAYPFFPFPMSEISDTVVEVDLIRGNKFSFLRERLLAVENFSQTFQIVETFLIKEFLSSLNFNPCIEYALREIIRQTEQISLDGLSRKIGYSQKHFISMFKNQIGITPKSYLKLMRFQKAVSKIEEQKEYDWALISNDCGFYDQSHFINNFKILSGFTPEQYISRKGSYLNYIPVA